MRRTWWVLALICAAGPAAAQGGPNREMLQRQVMERFIMNFQTQAGLTPDQSQRFREVMTRSFGERRQIETRQRQLYVALERQLRPGVAADEDSVRVILERFKEARQAGVDLTNRDQAAFAEFLSPIQQAQLVLSLERLQRQIETILRRRMQGGGAVREDG